MPRESSYRIAANYLHVLSLAKLVVVKLHPGGLGDPTGTQKAIGHRRFEPLRAQSQRAPSRGTWAMASANQPDLDGFVFAVKLGDANVAVKGSSHKLSRSRRPSWTLFPPC
jgi:hypothetical protein